MPLAHKVFTDALRLYLPTFRRSTCVSLLPKKGDLSNLKNWRPIALINTDAKVFTRLSALVWWKPPAASISPYQTRLRPGTVYRRQRNACQDYHGPGQTITNGRHRSFTRPGKSVRPCTPFLSAPGLQRFNFPCHSSISL